MKEQNYIEINRSTWNAKTEIHLNSDFYDQAGFMEGKNTLREIEIPLLGELKGKKILHLQCHFGQDSLSLARLGAEVVGIDFSETAIREAQKNAQELGLNARFICCDVYETTLHLDEQFDLVFTSYGTIGWLPDLNPWADVIEHFLKPGGRFVFVEFHPVVWMFDDNFEKIKFRYFQDAAIEETFEGTYADQKAEITSHTISWNHGLAEVVTSLLLKRLQITDFQEYDFSPYPCFADMVQGEKERFYIQKFGNKVPLVYSIVAEKPMH